DSAMLVVEGPLGISNHPDDFVVCSDGSATFTAVDTNTTNYGTVVYQWQVSTDTINYSNISDGGPFGYSGTNTSTLNIADVTGAGVRRYRLRISTGACNFVYSNHAQLIVEGPISIDPANQPEDVTICAENSAVFFTQVTNPGQGTVRY